MITHTSQGCRQPSGSTRALGPSCHLIGVPLGPWAREAAEQAGGQPHSPTGLGQAPLALLRSPPSMAPGDKKNHGELAGQRLPQQGPGPTTGGVLVPSLSSQPSERQNAVPDERNHPCWKRNPRVPCSPALAGRWGRPGDTLFLCSAGCWGDRSRGSVRDDVTREGVTREPLGLLNCSEL